MAETIRQPRDLETRAKMERPLKWMPPQLLPDPNPEPGFAFAGWGGDCSSTGNCVVGMNADKTVSASFTELPQYPVKTIKTGTGVISSDPAGIFCGGVHNQCSASFSHARLTASPHPGYEFIKWRGCPSPCCWHCASR